ncbi:MAG TPA: YqgE/AlgH family protein [Gammaproteobacteria bacterium]|jgi:putative transcriptional regulator|nr:YqgE/AlgH family protein [Gammaproteobacteria bacterium]
MTGQDFLTNHFLVAMPTLADPNFHRSVAFICEHNAQGALGIIINRPSNVVLGDIFKQLSITASDAHSNGLPVWQGGPVQLERGFVIHAPAGAWESTLKLDPDLGITSSRDVLNAVAHGSGPEKLFVALGYAGWGAGQLEAELAENAWLSTPADPHILFDLPVDQRWQAAAKSIGVDLTLLSGDAGHA